MVDAQYQQVQHGDGGPFQCLHNECPDFAGDHPWHFHPEFELTWVLASHGTRYVGDCLQPYVPGELVLLGPNLPHCWRNDGRSSETVEYVVILFNPTCLGDGFLEIPEAAAIKGLLDASASGLLFAPDTGPLIGPLMLEMERLTGMPKLIKLIELLDRLTRIERRPLTSPSYRNRVVVNQNLVDRLAHVQRYIDQRFRGVVCQAEIAEQLGMTAPSFSKFVRSATGSTFMHLVKLARIGEACRMLANGNEKITAVALDCGYQHTSHFDKHFMELKGVSPSDYRRKVQALAEANDFASAVTPIALGRRRAG